MKEYARALKDATKVSESDPLNSSNLVTMAIAKAELGKPEDGLTDANKALQLDQKNASALAIRASIYKKMGRVKEAKADWEQAHALGWRTPL